VGTGTEVVTEVATEVVTEVATEVATGAEVGDKGERTSLIDFRYEGSSITVKYTWEEFRPFWSFSF
jgi:hypothetical protein